MRKSYTSKNGRQKGRCDILMEARRKLICWHQTERMCTRRPKAMVRYNYNAQNWTALHQLFFSHFPSGKLLAKCFQHWALGISTSCRDQFIMKINVNVGILNVVFLGAMLAQFT